MVFRYMQVIRHEKQEKETKTMSSIFFAVKTFQEFESETPRENPVRQMAGIFKVYWREPVK